MKEVQVLFPTTVVKYGIPCGITEKEFNYCMSKYPTCRRNSGNLTGSDSDILEHDEMLMIKAHIENMLEDYKTNIMRISDDVEFYITQSWLNFSERGMSHHMHSHDNSVISGVLYLQVPPGADIIRFHNPVKRPLAFNHVEYDALNCGYWNYGVGVGQVILFPSNIVHSVPPNPTNALRISISFNTFVRGSLGSKNDLTHLTI